VPALDPVVAWRVVATPAALDAARWQGEAVDVLRIAPDEALGIGAMGVEVDDPDAIVQREAGFSSTPLTGSELRDISAHVEWEIPGAAQGRIVAQGKIAGVPAKLILADPPRLVVQTCYVLELRTRLGW
jgi:hypothetical protein